MDRGEQRDGDTRGQAPVPKTAPAWRDAGVRGTGHGGPDRPLPPLPASRLLVAGRRLLLLPRLIPLVGLNEAIVLQQVRYYLEEERRPRVALGRRWARATVGRWQARDFPFWTTRTIERTFASLIEQGLVLARQLDLTG